MWEIIHHWIWQYGYVAIFVLLAVGIFGLPIPDETLLAFAGYMVYRGHLNPVLTILAAVMGSMCGISMSYGLGRWVGKHVITKYGPMIRLTDERLKKVHDWFHRTGKLALVFGYFVPGVRHLTGFVAGTSKLEMPLFGLFAYTGAFLWSATFISIGYYFSVAGKFTREYFKHRGPELAQTNVFIAAIGLAIICAVGLVVFLVWRRLSKRA